MQAALHGCTWDTLIASAQPDGAATDRDRRDRGVMDARQRHVREHVREHVRDRLATW